VFAPCLHFKPRMMFVSKVGGLSTKEFTKGIYELFINC